MSRGQNSVSLLKVAAKRYRLSATLSRAVLLVGVTTLVLRALIPAGIDPLIMAPVQTADPDRHGAQRTDIACGLNFAGQHNLEGWRVALEYVMPADQDLDGPQLETDAQLILGVQKSW